MNITQESPKSANSVFSSYNYAEKSFITYDETSDTVYYVNYGKDDFLYAYKDEESKLVIETTVNFPNYYNGDIYFLSDGNRLPTHSYNPWGGSLYKYSISSKKTELLSEGQYGNLSIVGEYLYFHQGAGMTRADYKSLRMKIGGGELEDIGYATQYFYGEYQLIFEPVLEVVKNSPKEARVAARLALMSGDEVVPLTGVGHYWYSNFCISGDEFWLRNGGSLYCVNLDSGETKTYTKKTYTVPVGTVMETDDLGVFTVGGAMDWKMEGVRHFTVVDSVLYVGSESNMCVFWYDDDTEQFTPIEFNRLSHAYFQVYAVGSDIYTYGNNSMAGNSKCLMKYTLMDNGTYEKTEIYA